MFVVSERRCKIRDGQGFGSPMLELGPGVIVEFKTLKPCDINDEFISIFDSFEDAAESVGIEPAQKKAPAKKKSPRKKSTKKKASRKKADD